MLYIVRILRESMDMYGIMFSTSLETHSNVK